MYAFKSSIAALATCIAFAAVHLPTQAQPSDAASCIIVFSKGQNMSTTDPKVNDMWNKLNGAFGQFVAEQLRTAGKRVVEMPHPVEAKDMGVNATRLLKKASQEGCTMLVSASMYADQASRQFKSSLRANPIAAVKTDTGTNYVLAKETFKQEQAASLSTETLDQLKPSDIAKTLVDAFLSSSPN